MDGDIAIRTIVPILLLMVLGFFSRKLGILKSGDERVLNAYVYYFALPALFFVDLAEANFIHDDLRFVFAGIAPVILVVAIYAFLYLIFRFSKNTLYLLILSTVFGSFAFFGIPFIMFAFPTTEGEHLAALSASSISVISVTISITVLELYKLEKSTIWQGVKRVAKRLSKNPLIISIFAGILLSLSGLEIPSPISTPLHMLGSTTAAVAIFLLGVFLYGRRYTNMARAFELSLLRIIFLPILASLTTMVFNLPDLERTTLVLMHAMPVAISMIVLSERYDFHKETIASLILISSIGAAIYLNLWLLLLGYH
jgi:predicted permease